MTTTNWLVGAITQAIDTTTEQAMSASPEQRRSYRDCLTALNGLLGLALDNDPTLLVSMTDLISQIEADLSTQPSATTATRAPLEELVRLLGAWVEQTILTEELEQPS